MKMKHVRQFWKVSTVAAVMSVLVQSGPGFAADLQVKPKYGPNVTLLSSSKVASDIWHKGIGEGGRGIRLDQLGALVEQSLKAYGIEKFKVVKDFVIANFLQGTFTGDAEIGHISPVGAYDARRKKVWIMDVDRQGYEPYWVSDVVFLAGMATRNKSGEMNRGYVWVKLGE